MHIIIHVTGPRPTEENALRIMKLQGDHRSDKFISFDEAKGSVRRMNDWYSTKSLAAAKKFVDGWKKYGALGTKAEVTTKQDNPRRR